MNDRHEPDRFQIQVGGSDLDFRTIELTDPVPTGRQILKAAGAQPVEDHAAVAFLPDGALETLRLDETFDLREHGVEQVLVFRTDRFFRFLINDQDEEWGVPMISGRVLKGLARVDPAEHDVFLEVHGGSDVPVRDNELFDLGKPGVERFVTVPKAVCQAGSVLITVVVNGQPTEVAAKAEDLLATVREKALTQTENVGQPPENWELKDDAGVSLDLAATVGSFGFREEVTLYLSLKAGVAGA